MLNNLLKSIFKLFLAEAVILVALSLSPNLAFTSGEYARLGQQDGKFGVPAR